MSMCPPYWNHSCATATTSSGTERCVLDLVVKQEKVELEKREEIENFKKGKLKRTNTEEKNSLPDAQGKAKQTGSKQRC